MLDFPSASIGQKQIDVVQQGIDKTNQTNICLCALQIKGKSHRGCKHHEIGIYSKS
jgi:hypothetical protein